MGFSTFTLMSILMCTFLPPSSQHPNDQSCLTKLFQSMHVPNHKYNLQNWTKPNLANPCSGSTSNLMGVTCNNGRIHKLALSNLSLRGPISPYISNCTSLQSLDLSNNSLTGPIPTEFQYLVNLTILNLASNHLSGPIPLQLGSLVQLSVFNVSDNKLSGPIPMSLGNRTGNMSAFDGMSYFGNEDLCGYPLGPRKVNELSVVVIVVIGLGSGLVSLVLSYVVACVWLRVTDQKMDVEQQGKISQLMPEY